MATNVFDQIHIHVLLRWKKSSIHSIKMINYYIYQLNHLLQRYIKTRYYISRPFESHAEEIDMCLIYVLRRLCQGQQGDFPCVFFLYLLKLPHNTGRDRNTVMFTAME